MKSIRIRWRIVFGWICLVGAVTAMFFTCHANQVATTNKNSAMPPIKGQRLTSDRDQAFRAATRHPKNRREYVIDGFASKRLREHLETGQLDAIQEELTKLSESHQLVSVADVLKSWCGEGALELAQWSLAFSQDSDSSLNLVLCAEALSNPSDVIREIAAAQLEGISGIRFANTTDAKAWLSARLQP